MKTITIRFKVTFLILFLFVQSSLAQSPFGTPIFESCYQIVEGSRFGYTNYNFINNDGGRKIKMSSSNGQDIQNFTLNYQLYGDITWYPGGFVDLGQIYTVGAGISKLSILPNSNDLAYYETIISFVEPEFTLNSNSGTPPCFTFDDFNFNYTTNLHGLCKTPYFSIKMPPNAIQTWGLGNNYQQSVYENQSYQIPIDENFCSVNYCTNGNNTVSCCFTFDFEIIIQPCIGRENECPPIFINKPITVCCYCGTSDPGN